MFKICNWNQSQGFQVTQYLPVHLNKLWDIEKTSHQSTPNFIYHTSTMILLFYDQRRVDNRFGDILISFAHFNTRINLAYRQMQFSRKRGILTRMMLQKPLTDISQIPFILWIMENIFNCFLLFDIAMEPPKACN